MEETLVLIKPDGIQRKLIGEIISRFERAGLEIVGIKLVVPDVALVEEHYPASEKQLTGMGNNTLKTAGKEGAMKIFGTTIPREIGLKAREWMIKSLTSTPVIAMVLKGDSAIQRVRNLVGFTDPSKAAAGTIRGDLGADSIVTANAAGRSVNNVVHASGTVEEAKKEISLWFKSKTLYL